MSSTCSTRRATEDFSEDTYRVLAAADAAVMVLDAAKGIEPQTRKLFEVCRDRGVPLLTFINKWDRPGRRRSSCSTRSRPQLRLTPTPVTWPVGSAERFAGLVDRRDGSRSPAAHAALAAPGSRSGRRGAPRSRTRGRDEAAIEELELLDAVGHDCRSSSFLEGGSTPVFFGSALTNFGVRLLLDGVVDLAPPPSARPAVDGTVRALDDPFSAFVFKVQANMDPSHRDRIAFVRVCSGRFDRGMVVTHGPTGKPFATKYAHSVFGQERETIDEAFPGDVVGLVNATGVRVGDTLFAERPVEFAGIPSFAPELFASIRVRDTGRFKQFRSRHPPARRGGRRAGAARSRPTVGDPVADARRGRPDAVRGGRAPARARVRRAGRAVADLVQGGAGDRRGRRRALRAMRGARCCARDGTLLALFESPYWLERSSPTSPSWPSTAWSPRSSAS